MKKFLFFLILTICCISPGNAYQFCFEGEAAGKYPIVMEVDRDSNGAIRGRYAYKSTLKREGYNKRSSWLYITPKGNSTKEYTIVDSQGKLQERWFDAVFWREGNVNYFSVGVTNSRGKSFGISAQSASKHKESWVGTYEIHSDGYRMSPPPIKVVLVLSANGTNSYTGNWLMTFADDDTFEDVFSSSIVGKVNNGIMTLTLANVSSRRGYFTGDRYSRLNKGDVIAKITKCGSSYKIQPVGKMKEYLSGLGGILSIVKTK